MEVTNSGRWSRGFIAAFALIVCGGASVLADPPPMGLAPVLVPSGGFRIDGDLLADASGGDWLGGTNAASGVLNAAGLPMNPATTFHFVDPFGVTSDNTFVGGLKWTDDPGTWQWTSGKPSSKTDINNVLLHIAPDAGGHTWTAVAADRASTSGDSYIDFEFLQNTLVQSNNGTFASAGPNGGRTVNDLLLSLAFISGGKVADFLAYRWLPDGNGGFAYMDVTTNLPIGRVFVALNSNNVAVPYGAFNSTTYAPNAFVEAAIDLTALLGGFDPCLSIGFKTIMVKTKSSPSTSATINDFIAPIQYSLRIGPAANAGPDQARCNEGDSTAFPLQGQAFAGAQPISSTSWSVVSGSATIDSPSSLITTARVSSATATLRLSVLQANGCTETNDVLLTVADLPSCSISGSPLLCPNSTNQFQAPGGLSTYSWTISGNATISGATNSQTVTVISGGACSASFTLNLAAALGICSTACSMDVLVADTTPPTMVIPSDRLLECPANTTTNATGVATAQDDCGEVHVTYSDFLTSNCGNTKVIARTWTATDHCGNATNAVQTIIVQDTTPPTLALPPNLTLDCPANLATSNTGLATSQDGCGAVTVTYSDSVSNNCGGSSIVKRLWTATDACGNTTNGLQTITVRDIKAPSLSVPPSLTLDCPADTTTNNTGIATAQDGCSQATVTYSDSVSNSCGSTKLIRRTWTATDTCGNSTNALQLITVRDTTPPSITAPPNLVLECPASTATNATGMALAQDGCSSVTIAYSDSISNSCGGARVITRTWTATDACGNAANAVQTITVRDSTPPSLTLPPNLTLECPATTTTNNTGLATAQDGCGSVTLTFSDSVITNCANTKVIARTWTATDACGNFTNGVQTITVRDSTPPSLTLPPNLTLECPANTNTSNTGIAAALDGCGSVTVTFSDSISNGCGGARVIARSWTATDACGNFTNAVQTITVHDSTPPSLILPPNLTLECPAVTTTNNTGVATAQDGCGSVTLTFSDSVITNCANTKVIARTWTAADACGNFTNAIQTITVRDSTPPSLTLPPNLTLECPANTNTSNTGIATAQDGCSSVTVTYSDSVSNSCGGARVIARTWTATDACGNTANGLQTITVRDSTPPSLVLPANLTLECPASTATNNTGVATAQDGCGSVTVTFSDSVSNSCGGTKLIRRTWTATDTCGNFTNAVQTIIVRDSTPPSLVLPANVVLECPSINTSTNFTGVAAALDGCGSVTVSYNDVVTTNCGPTKVIARTWTATDACGNTTNGLQTITVRDTISPSLIAPPNLVLECPAITTTNNTGTAIAQDGCSSVTVTYSDSVSNSCGGTKLIRRTWTATDACGNSTNALQLITVRDTTPPSITAPPNLVLECPASTATNATGMALAQDGCSSMTIAYSDSISNICGGARVITRTWTATDACGNAASALQVITLLDHTPPSLVLPTDRILQCPGDTRTNVTGSAIAVDACGSVTLIYSDTVSNSCGFTKTVLRLWTATDACGNSTNGLQTITVIDTNKPTIICPNVSVQCAGDVPAAYTNLLAFQAAGGSASDACSATLSFVLISDSGVIGRCPGSVTRVYRVTDACGNYADGTQVITIRDTIPPVMSCASNTTVECGLSLDPINTGRPTATDNCSTNVTLSYSDSTADSQYSIKFYAADSDINSGPYAPTYLKLAPASLPVPDSARLTGRALDPLRNAVAYASTNGALDALMVLNGGSMSLGQVVPFEVVIEASGAPGPERGTVEFTASWHTYTTSNNRFGFDTNYMVYGAFVDGADPGLVDPNFNARVEAYSSTILNRGTIDEVIQGTFRVSGLDTGDRVVVEIWMVLDSNAPQGGGTVSATLDSFQKDTVPPQQISVGTQTTGIGNLNKLNPLPPPQAQPPLGTVPPQQPVPPGCLISIVNRSWTATDDCGNQSTCVQQISIRDTTRPMLIAPADLLLDCQADTTTNNTGVAIASEGCGSVLLSYSDIVSNTCGGGRIISRNWTAVDQCGNATNHIQTITVRGLTTLTAPASLVLECPADTRTNVTGVATVQNNCSAVTMSYTDVVTNACAGTKVIARTWTATDACGSTVTALQTITVRDTTPPTLIVPPNLTFQCPSDTSTNTCGTATAQDGCSQVMVTFLDATLTNADSSVLISRTWTATDACGNTASGIQTITFSNPTPPTITPKLIRTLTLNSQTHSLVETNFIAVFPNGLIIGNYSPSNGPTAPNGCFWQPSSTGVAALASTTATLQPPTGPADSLAHDVLNPTNAAGNPLAGQAILLSLNVGFNTAGVLGAGPNNFGSLVYQNSGDSLTGRSVSRILTAANRALSGLGLPEGYDFNSLALLLANVNASFQNDSASSWAAAHLGSPMLLVQCPGQVPAPDSNTVSATNGCGGTITLTSVDTFDAVVTTNNYTLLRTWVARDSAGNTGTCSYKIVVQDLTPPTVSVAPDQSLLQGTPWSFGQPVAADNCGAVTVAVLSTLTNVTGSTMRITRTWMATDASGNNSTCSQSVTITLATPPTFATQPVGQTYEFDDNASLSVTVNGTGPFTYQWLFNGAVISGATNSSLDLTQLQYTDAGLYSVVVTGPGGSITSSAAVVNVAPRLLRSITGSTMILSWTGPFVLQSSSNVTGPYVDVPGAQSPYSVSMTAPRQFFRLRSLSAVLDLKVASGQATVTVTGSPGEVYVIQAATDLAHWTNLATNALPFTFVDTDSVQFPVRYYRAQWAH